jgi:hypothetical protein
MVRRFSRVKAHHSGMRHGHSCRCVDPLGGVVMVNFPALGL